MSTTPELSEAERIRVEAFGLDKPEGTGKAADKAWGEHIAAHIEHNVPYGQPIFEAGMAAAQAVSLPDRETLRRVVGGVLWNATNYPRKAQPYLLGTDTAPLTGKVVDAVLAALSTQPAAGEVETQDDLATLWERVADVHGPDDTVPLSDTYRSHAAAVRALTAQLRAAQATIAEAKVATDWWQEVGGRTWSAMVGNAHDILSRADTSALRAHDEALIRQHTQTILNATREATVQAIADAEVRGYQRKLDERITAALAASIEQTEANHG